MIEKISLALTAITTGISVLMYLHTRPPGGKHRKRKRYRRGKRQR